MLPRTIDKARAAIDGKLGEYKYGEASDFDMHLFETLGVDAESFLDGVRRSPDDDAVLRWLHANARTVADRDDERLLETLLQNAKDELRVATDAEERRLLLAFCEYLEARLARLRGPKPPRDP